MRSELKARPKVFISYSWSNDELKRWVLLFATELMEKWGIEVILDHWDLTPGQDMYHFMEESVQSADKVLIICDRSYTDKANARQRGGVGTEAQIISPEVYQNTKQEKFIPVFYEKCNRSFSLSGKWGGSFIFFVGEIFT